MHIAHIGNLANNAFIFCNFLRRKGVDAHIFLFPKEQHFPKEYEGSCDWEKEDWIHFLSSGKKRRDSGSTWSKIAEYLGRYDIPLEFSDFDIVHSWTAALLEIPFAHSLLKWKGIPYIAVATGSDLREETRKMSLKGIQIRKHFKRACLTASGPDRLNVEQIRELGLDNHLYIHLPIDTDKSKPLPKGNSFPEFDLLFFHPSRIDWGIKDGGKVRSSMKQTDRFFRALAHFNSEGGNAGVIVAERGQDLPYAKKLVEELGLRSYVRWIPSLTQEELPSFFNQCDVVVDQFSVGSFGTTALEAMACGKPVMIYIDKEFHQLSYPKSPPPVLNCQNEGEIYQCIKQAANPFFCRELGQKARQFIMEFHHWEVVIDEWIDIYRNLIEESKRKTG